MPLYETTLIIRQDAAKSDATKLADSFAKIITDEKGKVAKNEYWGLRTLSYIINKNRKGHYVHFNLDAEPAAVKEMERKMRLDDNVIRHMTIRVDAFTETPGSVSGSGSYDEAA